MFVFRLLFCQAHSVGSILPSDGNITGVETHFASLALTGAAVTTPTQDNAFSSQPQFKARDVSALAQRVTAVSQSEKDAAQISSVGAPVFPNEAESASSVDISAAFGDLSHQKPLSEMERLESPSDMSEDKRRCQPAAGARKYFTRAASWSSSASLPRGFRQSEGSCRLSSVITARPFGTKPSGMSTLPKRNNVSVVDVALH